MPTEPKEDSAPVEDHAPAEDHTPVEDVKPVEDPLIPAEDAAGAKTYTQ